MLMLAACQGGGGDDYPIIAQGDDGPITPTIDAPMADASGDAIAGMINGRVCLMTDWRTPTMGCATTGAAGITVLLGTSSATTNVDGSFSISMPSGTGLVWRVGSVDVVQTVMPFASTDLIIPAMLGVRWDDFLLDNGVILNVAEGSIMLRVIGGGAPVSGVTASASPAAGYAPFYDGINATIWDQDATNVRGMVWIAGAPSGASTTVSLLAPAAASSVDVGLPVESQSITFATVEIP